MPLMHLLAETSGGNLSHRYGSKFQILSAYSGDKQLESGGQHRRPENSNSTLSVAKSSAKNMDLESGQIGCAVDETSKPYA